MDDPDVLFDGLSLKVSDYKSIGPEPQGFDCFRRLNVIIGRNNSGKSALIDLVKHCVDFDFRVAQRHWNNRRPATFEFSVILKAPTLKKGIGSVIFHDLKTDRESLIHALCETRLIWKRKEGSQPSEFRVTGFRVRDPLTMFYKPQSFQEAGGRIAQVVPRPFDGKTFRRVLSERDIKAEKESTDKSVDGNGVGATNMIQNYLNQENLSSDLVEADLLEALNSIFQPDGVFKRIQVQKVEGDLWEVFLIEDSKGRIALSHSGSGLKTILLVLINLILVPAAEERELKSYVFAFEELENNLHPALLRRLLEYIARRARTDQFMVFLTTHSSTTIDFFSRATDAQIVHVRHDGNSASTSTLKTYVESKLVLDDLDIRASDLLQANCVIWVEGPSDRLYLNHWLKLWSFDFVEGVHYQCVFYGGRLLKHLEASPDDEDTSGVQILRLARHACILMDSDRRRKTDGINSTKQRLQREIHAIGGMVWISAGREIENYIPLDAIKKWKPVAPTRPRPRIFESMFRYLDKLETGLGKRWEGRKPGFADEICQHFDLESCRPMFDLNEKMLALGDFIRRANGERG